MKNNIRTLARNVMQKANRRGYGLGECGYYFETYGWDMIQEKHDVANGYNMYDDERINWAEKTRLKEEQPEIFKEWRELVSGAQELAYKLEGFGVSEFN